MARSLKGSLHAHGCTRCHERYVDACQKLKDDALCTRCRGGRPWMLLIHNAHPQDCCTASSRLASKDEREAYRLAGAHIWFICATCKRTHPYDPTRTPKPDYTDQPQPKGTE